MSRSDPMLALGEETMIEAWRLLLRMPDREKGWQRSGSKSWWPEIVKDLQADYADADAAPRLQLSRREYERCRRAWWAQLCYAEAVPWVHGRLFMTVIAAKAGRMPGGFRWEDVGARLYGKAWGTARCDATSDALRMRYEACLRCVAIRIAVWECGAAAA